MRTIQSHIPKQLIDAEHFPLSKLEATVTANQYGTLNHYRISGIDTTKNPAQSKGSSQHIVDLIFHDGNPALVGSTGITMEALLAVVEDRLVSLQAGAYPIHFNDTAMYHVGKALEALHERTMSLQPPKASAAHKAMVEELAERQFRNIVFPITYDKTIPQGDTFVNSIHIAHSDILVQGAMRGTAPLTFSIEHNLLDLTSTPELVSGGVVKPGDFISNIDLRAICLTTIGNALDQNGKHVSLVRQFDGNWDTLKSQTVDDVVHPSTVSVRLTVEHLEELGASDNIKSALISTFDKKIDLLIVLIGQYNCLTGLGSYSVDSIVPKIDLSYATANDPNVVVIEQFVKQLFAIGYELGIHRGRSKQKLAEPAATEEVIHIPVGGAPEATQALAEADNAAVNELRAEVSAQMAVPEPMLNTNFLPLLTETNTHHFVDIRYAYGKDFFMQIDQPNYLNKDYKGDPAATSPLRFNMPHNLLELTHNDNMLAAGYIDSSDMLGNLYLSAVYLKIPNLDEPNKPACVCIDVRDHGIKFGAVINQSISISIPDSMAITSGDTDLSEEWKLNRSTVSDVSVMLHLGGTSSSQMGDFLLTVGGVTVNKIVLDHVNVTHEEIERTKSFFTRTLEAGAEWVGFDLVINRINLNRQHHGEPVPLVTPQFAPHCG